MNRKPTAADALPPEAISSRPEVMAEGLRIADWLRGMGMLSTAPTEAVGPFARRPVTPLPTHGVKSQAHGGWSE